MKLETRAALTAYYAEGDSWAADRNGRIRSSRRIAWIIAAVAVVVALSEALALAALFPLKTVVPYTLLVDKQTGFVQLLKPLQPNMIAPDAALTQSLLVQYVIARESFDIDALQSNYRRVGLWSAENARSEYLATTEASNPHSPLSIYPRSTVVEARVRSVSPIGDHMAMVRFETQRRDAGGQAQPAQSFVAVIRYRFSGEPMSVENRYINPLGFEVIRYRRDAEALPPSVPKPEATIGAADRKTAPTQAPIP